ncbi:30S ribosomal protein S9 [uncultured archaeon]|nr:30S ribosomal protein S9 [uncultured archaeon]
MTAKKREEKPSKEVKEAKEAKQKAESVETVPAAAEKKPRVPRKKSGSGKPEVVFTRGKRKEAVARASIKKGNGKVTINKFLLETYGNKYLKAMIYEPLTLAGPAAREIDIRVTVYGGGETGQAEAVRQAIARGICEFTGDEGLRKKMVEYDRHLLSEDARRVEPKKYKGPKARARFQKSYR